MAQSGCCFLTVRGEVAVSIGVSVAVLASMKVRLLLSFEATPPLGKIEMPKTLRLWLLASCLCTTFALAPAARATQVPLTWTPKPQPGPVKPRLLTFIG